MTRTRCSAKTWRQVGATRVKGAGKRCSRMAQEGERLCWQHQRRQPNSSRYSYASRQADALGYIVLALVVLAIIGAWR